MDSYLSPQPATRHRWHERIEHYTPNDASGRLLVAIPSGSFGVYTLTWSVATFMTSGLLLPLTLLLVGVSVGAIILSIMMIWPVYLSLIGNVESAKSYPQVDATPSSEENCDDSIDIVKRQYAAGNISEAEFERRVENLLHADAEFGLQPGTMSHRDDRDTIRETD